MINKQINTKELIEAIKSKHGSAFENCRECTYGTHNEEVIAKLNQLVEIEDKIKRGELGNIKVAIKDFADNIKSKLEKYRLDNEEEIDNGWIFNSSQFCVDIDCEGGLIDELAEKYINEN